MEIFRYVSSISSLPAEFMLLTIADIWVWQGQLCIRLVRKPLISIEVSSQPLVIVRAEQTH